jgi:hypothetical protein
MHVLELVDCSYQLRDVTLNSSFNLLTFSEIMAKCTLIMPMSIERLDVNGRQDVDDLCETT